MGRHFFHRVTIKYLVSRDHAKCAAFRNSHFAAELRRSRNSAGGVPRGPLKLLSSVPTLSSNSIITKSDSCDSNLTLAPCASHMPATSAALTTAQKDREWTHTHACCPPLLRISAPPYLPTPPTPPPCSYVRPFGAKYVAEATDSG